MYGVCLQTGGSNGRGTDQMTTTTSPQHFSNNKFENNKMIETGNTRFPGTQNRLDKSDGKVAKETG